MEIISQRLFLNKQKYLCHFNFTEKKIKTNQLIRCLFNQRLFTFLFETIMRSKKNTHEMIISPWKLSYINNNKFTKKYLQQNIFYNHLFHLLHLFLKDLSSLIR